MSSSKYDVIIVGAGIAGPSMAFALSTSSALRSSLPQNNQRSKPLRILLIERSLRTPDRIVGELLQPGGCLALKRLGLERALDNIDAVRAKGYCIIRPKGKAEGSSAGPSMDAGAQFEQVYIPYPNAQEGRSFHHGEFVSALRSCAASAPGVTVLEANVSSKVVYCPHTGRILGVRATPTGENQKEQIYLAKLTIFASGSSTFRRAVYLPNPIEDRKTASAGTSLPSSGVIPAKRNLDTKALGTFYGLVLPHPSVSHILPLYQHGTVILIPGSAGPLLLYQISKVDTRILIDIPKNHTYAKNVQGYVKDIILPNLPTEALRESLQNLIEDNESTSGRLKLRSMENPFFPAPPQGGRRTREGSILIGDAWNQRHPLTGGGMTVALWDVVTLASELIMAEKALFGDGSFSTPPTPVNEGMKGYSKNGDKFTEVNGELMSLRKHEEEWAMGQWDIMDEIFDRWWWKRKGYAATINILSVALYDLFGGSCTFSVTTFYRVIIDPLYSLQSSSASNWVLQVL
jgi:squalene monooxygenase